MTARDQTPERDRGHGSRDDIIAAEYVLGVLSSQDRRDVEKRIATDPAFQGLVRNWETHFSGLNDAYEAVSPDAAAFQRIETRLFPVPDKAQTVKSGLWNSLAFWRGMAALTTAVAVAAIISLVFTAPLLRTQPSISYTAELSSPNDPLAMMVAYDGQSGKMVLTPIAAKNDGQQKSLELWLVNQDGTPRSLGILDPSNDAEIIVAMEMRDQLRDGMTLAVSLEPLGGSPTGKPTGPVLASGTTRQL